MKGEKIYIKGVAIYIVSIIILVALDQMTKALAVTHLKNKAPFVIMKNVFELYYLENTGTAWGMMSGAIPFFVVITLLILIAVTWLTLRIPKDHKYIPMRVLTILIGAGAIGNFIDRILNGYVIDFLYFKLISFPVFNVADCYVTISMILMAVLVLFVYKEDDYKFIRMKKEKEKEKEKENE